MELEVALLKEQLGTLSQRHFGESSERRPTAKPRKKSKPKRGHGPRSQESLPSVGVVEVLEDEATKCPKCDGQLQPMKGVTEDAEYITRIELEFRLVREHRQKYRCTCNEAVVTAPSTARKLVKGGRYDVSFGVGVVVDKYVDHLPLERQCRAMKRQGLVIDSQTLWDQVRAVATHLVPSYLALRDYILGADAIGVNTSPGQTAEQWTPGIGPRLQDHMLDALHARSRQRQGVAHGQRYGRKTATAASGAAVFITRSRKSAPSRLALARPNRHHPTGRRSIAIAHGCREANTVREKSIVIVGGGTAGWITAAILGTRLRNTEWRVVLLESNKRDTIGVGEATLPLLRELLAFLELPEHEWMPPSKATYKLGVKFTGWAGERSSWFHPFWSPTDVAHEQEAAAWLGIPNRPQLSACALGTHLSSYPVAPKAAGQPSLRMLKQAPYAYHISARDFAAWLSSVAARVGVHHVEGTVSSVVTRSNTEIDHLVTERGALYADHFVDCTGFRRVLISRLGPGYTSYAGHLLCDSALVASAPASADTLANFTECRALPSGWRWEIPITDRIAYGYVHASAFAEATRASDELCASLAGHEYESSARRIRFETGRLDEPWVGNCTAIGLSAGFIEPLESTTIALVQFAAAQLALHFPSFDSSTNRRRYCNEMCAIQDALRDFIVAHYALSPRRDTEFWRACTEGMELPASLEQVLGRWRSSGELPSNAMETQLFPNLSWLALFDGLGYRSKAPPKSPSVGIFSNRIERLRRKVPGLVSHLPSHREFLASLPGLTGPGLQAYGRN